MEKRTHEITIDSIGKLKITKEVQETIDELHQKVGNTEWSGVLFYKLTKGDYKTLKNLEFTTVFLYPLDIGTQTFTEFNYDKEIMSAYDLCEEAISSHRGIIHTHHNMDTFFSNTDKNELINNSERYNFYLSLIVNFKGKYSCKIAIPSKVKRKNKYSIKDPNGAEISIKNDEILDAVLISDLEIEYYENKNKIRTWIDDVIDRLKISKNKKTMEMPDLFSAYSFENNYPNDNHIKKEEKIISDEELFLNSLFVGKGDIDFHNGLLDDLDFLFMNTYAGSISIIQYGEFILSEFDSIYLETFNNNKDQAQKKKIIVKTITLLEQMEDYFYSYNDLYITLLKILNIKLNDL